MLHRIRLAMQDDGPAASSAATSKSTKLSSAAKRAICTRVSAKRLGISQSRSMIGKVAVMGLLERHGEKGGSRIRTEVVANRKKHQLEQTVGEHVTEGATVYTDALRSYDRMGERGYVHHVIDHAEAYVDGQVHTNGLENFWSLLKRAPQRHLRVRGTVSSVPLPR